MSRPSREDLLEILRETGLMATHVERQLRSLSATVKSDRFLHREVEAIRERALMAEMLISEFCKDHGLAEELPERLTRTAKARPH